MSADCESALVSKSGGLYWPWGPYLDAGSVRGMRAALLNMIETLAALETWPKEYRDEVSGCAAQGSAHALTTNIAYFEKRLIAAQCKVAAAELRDARIWHGEGLEDRMTTSKEPTWNTKIRSTKARGKIPDRMADRVRREAR